MDKLLFLLKSNRLRKSIFGILTFFSFLIFFQQCSRVDLTEYKAISFLSVSTNPHRLEPPRDLPVIRRYVFFVDMSNSMISGSCPQDLDRPGFSTTPEFKVYDPNLGVGDPNDHRASGIDCAVDPTLEMDVSSLSSGFVDAFDTVENLALNHLKTFNGLDVDGTRYGLNHDVKRFQILQTWLTNIVNANPNNLDNISVMIVPMVGGLMGKTMEERMLNALSPSKNTPVYFSKLSEGSYGEIVSWLANEQDRNYTLVKDSNNYYRYKETTMGVSSFGGHLKTLYEVLMADMESLETTGKLPYAEYDLLFMSDGHLTPLKKHFEDARKLFGCNPEPPEVSEQTAQQEGQVLSHLALCNNLEGQMTDAWGDPKENEIANLDFDFGKIQVLPYYFKSGYVRMSFLETKVKKGSNPTTYANTKPGVPSFFDELQPYFASRNQKVEKMILDSSMQPFKLLGEATNSLSYKVTNFYMLNPTFRLSVSGEPRADSDGDGAFDEEELLGNTNPRISRSNGVCLDSIFINPAYADRCSTMEVTHSCDPQIDTDGDSLNECEESLLGTDPFDFDTDGDAMPDSLEWIYGYNPSVSDIGVDSNSDGILNTIQFAAGIGPEVIFKDIPNNYKTIIEVNYQGKDRVYDPGVGNIWVELFQVIFKNSPLHKVQSVVAGDQLQIYASRRHNESTKIKMEDQLITFSSKSDRNSILVLARMVDQDDPGRAYWRLLKQQVPVTQVISQPEIDLSQLKQIRAMDRGQ